VERNNRYPPVFNLIRPKFLNDSCRHNLDVHHSQSLKSTKRFTQNLDPLLNLNIRPARPPQALRAHALYILAED
jgi:hypothetical protein